MGMSMTGYGVDTFHIDGTTITVEIRSINSRYLDFIPKIPRSLYDLEVDIKKIIQTYFHRGRIEVYISITGNITNKKLQVDYHLIDQYIKHIKEIQDTYMLEGEIPLSILTANDNLFTIEETETSSESLKPLLLESVKKTATIVLANRQGEGAFLIEDICNRVKKIKSMLKSIEERQDFIYTHYRDRIQGRIEKHIGNTVSIEQTQLVNEIALLAEKGDIAEELTRLYSHLHHFNQVVQSTGPNGRKLDFITQEMHREINTIGSKSVDPAVSESVVTIKSEIEKVKEQLQNIE